MEKNFQIERLSNDDALEFTSGAYRVGKVIETIRQVFLQKLGKQLYELLKEQQVSIHQSFLVHAGDSCSNWFEQGIECQILKVGAKGWQKGKIRLKVTLEFCPDEPENNTNSDSSLDDIRQIIK